MTTSNEDHRRLFQSFADGLFAEIGSRLSGAKSGACYVFNMNIPNGILEATNKLITVLIAMSSSTRGGLAGVFIGSDTHRVIVGTNLPVLVVKLSKDTYDSLAVVVKAVISFPALIVITGAC